MAAGFKGILDFSGLGVGKPGAGGAAAGFRGILDFTGVSAGVPSTAPPAGAGFFGLLDFTGLAGGGAAIVPPPPPPPPVQANRLDPWGVRHANTGHGLRRWR